MIKGYLLVGCWEECEGGVDKAYSGKLHPTKEGVRKEFDQAREEGHCFDSFRIIEQKREDIDVETFIDILNDLTIDSPKSCGYAGFLNHLSMLFDKKRDADLDKYKRHESDPEYSYFKDTSEFANKQARIIYKRLAEWGYYGDVRKMREMQKTDVARNSDEQKEEL